MRVPAGGGAVGFFAFTMWTANVGWSWNSTDMFQLLSWFAFVYCLLAGVLSTADCLSIEKRHNTLGLLFLTDLRGYDVVFGKLCANSLSCSFGLLAILPVLAIPLIMGGVQYGEFWRVALSLATTLLVSLSIGLYISTLGTNAFRNTAIAVLVMCLLGFGIPALVELLNNYRRWPRLAATISHLSPFYMHLMAFSGAWARPTPYWTSVAFKYALIAGAIGLSCWRLPRTWQDSPGTAGRWSFGTALERWRRWNLGTGSSRSRFRGRLLEKSPFAWLAGRERVSSAGLLILYIAVIILTVRLGSIIESANPGVSMSELFPLWMVTAAILHGTLLAKIGSMASERFGSDRQSGALELLLSTPLSVRTIVRGQWRAMLRQLFGPAVIAMAVHGLVFYLASRSVALHSSFQLGGKDMLSAIWQSLTAHSPVGPWDECLALLCIVAAAVVLAAHWIALGWTGMWLSLRLRQPRFAPWLALAVVIVPPWILFAMTIIGLLEYESIWSDARWFFVCFKVAVSYQLLYDLGLTLWASRRVKQSFRAAAADRFEFSPPALPWPFLARRGLRWAAAPTTAALLLGAFHLEENWRGERAWNAVESEMNSRGELLDVEAHVPMPIPADQNFAETPVMADGLAFDGRLTQPGPRGIITTPARSLRFVSISLTGQPKGYPDGFRAWASQRRTDFERWLTQYRARGLIPTNTAATSAASDMLLALSGFEEILSELEAASERPSCRYPNARPLAWEAPRPHLTLLCDVSEVLRYRAAAELVEGLVAEAFDDLRLCVYLADTLDGEPYVESHAMRNELMMGVLQLVWEGLENDCWTEPQILWLQGHLGEINRLEDLSQATRALALSQIDSWNRKRAERLKKGGLWRLTRLLSPMGWTYLNQAGIYRTLQTDFGDPELKRVYLSRAATAHQALIKHLPSRYGHQLDSLADSFAHVQTGLHQAVIACALARFRQDFGEYPSKLQSLIPMYIDTLPHDVVNGEPLHYQRLARDAFVLFSVGKNEQNDAGRPGADWVWRYPKKPRKAP